MVDFNFRSRYRRTQVGIYEGAETVGVWNQPNFLKQRPSEDQIFRYYVSSAFEGRPDLIADSVFGSPFLDWVLIAFNAPVEVLNWPPAGTTIEYPSPYLVQSQL